MTAEVVWAQRAIGLLMRTLQRKENSKEDLKWNNKHGVHVGRVCGSRGGKNKKNANGKIQK